MRLKTITFESGVLESEFDFVGGSGYSISSSVADTGSYSMRINNSANQGVVGIYPYGDVITQPVIFIRFRFRVDTAPASTRKLVTTGDDNTEAWQIRLTSDRRLQLFDSYNGVQIGSNSAQLSVGTFYTVECMIDFRNLAACLATLKLNGTQVGSGAVDHTPDNSQFKYFYFGGFPPSTQDLYVDNILVNDNTGDSNNSWIGDGNVPTVTTVPASSITATTASLTGDITAIGSSGSVAERGFQYNTIPAPDKEISTESAYSTGSYNQTLSNLLPNTTYYYRAFATDSNGTGYGTWESFTTADTSYAITIDGVDRTGDVINQTLTIEDVLNDQQNTCSFRMVDISGNGIPSPDEEIIITDVNGTRIFAGYILSTVQEKQPHGKLQAQVRCIDYSRLLDRNLAHRTYQEETDADIINNLVTTYCAGFGITTTNVVEGVTIDQIAFNYVQISQALRRICDLTGRNWYIDYDKDIHYFPLIQNPAPFNITSSSSNYFNLNISKDNSQLKNRVYVRGGTKLSDTTTYQTKGDGVKRQFILPDKPHDVTVYVNGVEKSLGIKHIDTSGFDFYLNFQEKYIDQDEGGVVLTDSDTFRVDYKYDIPILVAIEEPSSILANGVKEFAIFDKTITTNQAARDRATAELTDYALTIVEGSFQTYETGFRSGQYINITLSEYGISADYIVNRVAMRSIGAGKFIYTVSLASAKTMGIIRFLIELLEANKNLIELDDDEVVDELLGITDSLNADSLQDQLTIDSAGAYATWCTDSLQSTPITRARWDLFQWG